ncbi:short-chain oxidoreductase [Psychromonas sp. psych-6C06]|uniref:IucA/IucC family protein n=1 Tax=Psychromonas sp. psych-6C06 TaxID=2058089 RepID=UPI000C33DE28|nr:IucA/IucC family protein [Psychromonas sp. psych-6C06]PKF61555.1 short-chain oxidoreductase [Psychromonas sp. psych-6C06]
MTVVAEKIANNASFQSFINCYLREIDAGVLHINSDWQQKTSLSFSPDTFYVLELQLNNVETSLAIGLTYYSLVGRHVVSDVYQKKNNHWQWQAIDHLSTILLLINNIYHADDVHCSESLNQNKMELLARTLESHQVMQDYIAARFEDPSLQTPSFINSEQSILFGHWLHPTPKSRQGIHQWQHQHYTPELASEFQLHFFAVDRTLVRESSILPETAADIIQLIVDKAPNKERLASLNDTQQLIPVHPLQAQWLLHQDDIKTLITQGAITDVGAMGATFTPTSSVRTLYCDDLPFMIKLSIPVKITNSLRKNMEHELDAGLNMGNLLRNHDFSDTIPHFNTIDDPAYMTLTLPEKVESGFELIIRENPFYAGANSDSKSVNVQSIAALMQAPLNPTEDSPLTKIITTLASKSNISKREASLQWFDAYWQCAIESAIKLYDSYGIALEAHQQNSLLDVSDGIPSRYYYRDNQGFYLSNHLREQLLAMEPNLHKTLDLFYDDEVICDRFSYYLFINQLFSVINRFGIDQLVSENELLEVTQHKLKQLLAQLNSVGIPLVESLLTRRDIPCKGNLLTRISDVDELQADQELAIYTAIKNPLYRFSATVIDLMNNKNEAYLESA